MTPAEIAKEKTPLMIDALQQVWFDAATGLPAKMQQGDYSETYEFTAPPTTALDLPNDYRSALESFLSSQVILNQRLNQN
jgi:hypothetical protein